MQRTAFIGAAVIATLALSACHKSGSNAGNDINHPGDSAPVNTAQDVAAGPVGLASAATVGANTTAGYVTGAAMGDMYEVEAGKIAAQRAKSPEIKAFAQMMVVDHTKSTNDLKAALATANAGVTPPADLDDRRKGMLQNLRAAGDADFDLAYLHQQLAAHLEALTIHGGYAAHGDNPVLKDVAAKIKLVVEHHIAEIKRIGGDKLKGAT
jgi:putative membrane protein